MENKLKPCLTCDSILIDVENTKDKKYRSVCFHCGTCGPNCETEAEAVDAWNRRAEDNNDK